MCVLYFKYYSQKGKFIFPLPVWTCNSLGIQCECQIQRLCQKPVPLSSTIIYGRQELTACHPSLCLVRATVPQVDQGPQLWPPYLIGWPLVFVCLQRQLWESQVAHCPFACLNLQASSLQVSGCFHLIPRAIPSLVGSCSNRSKIPSPFM